MSKHALKSYFGKSICILFLSLLTMPEVVFGVIHLDLGSEAGPPGSDVTIAITLNYGDASPNISATSNDIGFDTNFLESSCFSPSTLLNTPGDKL